VTGHELKTKSFQDRQDAIDGYREAAQRWRDESARYRRSFAEDYSRMAIALFYHLEFSASSMLENQGPFGAEQSFVDSVPFPMLVFHKEGVELHGLDSRNQKFVFVHNVEVVKMGQTFSIPSKVRLYHVQKSVSDSDDGLLLFSLIEKRYKMVTVNIDREVLFESLSSVTTDNLPPSEIKSALKVVKGISKDEREAVRHGLRRDLNEIISGFAIRFDGDYATTTLKEFSAARVKILDVLVGPFEF